MGCGASKSLTVSIGHQELERDPEDFELEPLKLQTCNIAEFDGVFSQVEELLNQLIFLNNNINDAVAQTKASLAILVEAFELDVTVKPCADFVLLDLFKSGAANVPPDPDEIKRLLKEQSVRDADLQLEQARWALMDFLSTNSTHVHLKTAADSSLEVAEMQHAPAPLVRFNEAFHTLRKLLGDRYHMHTMVKTAGAFGTPTLRAKLIWRYRPTPTSLYSYEPVSLLNVYATRAARQIKEAEAYLADRVQHLAHRTKGMDLRWDVIAGHRGVITTEIMDDEIRGHIQQLLGACNTALFWLLNAGASVRGGSSLTQAVLETVRPAVMFIKRRHDGDDLPYTLKTLITAKPTVEVRKQEGDSSPCFDFRFNVDIKEQADVPQWPQCLPEEALSVLAAIENLKTHVNSGLQQLAGISREVDGLLEQAKDFYELAPEAASNKGLSMMEAVRAAKATGTNLKALFDSRKYFVQLSNNVQRITEELGASSKEVDLMITKQLGFTAR